jgi:hypothetical protein
VTVMQTGSQDKRPRGRFAGALLQMLPLPPPPPPLLQLLATVSQSRRRRTSRDDATIAQMRRRQSFEVFDPPGRRRPTSDRNPRIRSVKSYYREDVAQSEHDEIAEARERWKPTAKQTNVSRYCSKLACNERQLGAREACC